MSGREPGWSARTFFGEVARNLRSRPLGFLLVSLITVGCAIAAGASDMITWRDDAGLQATQEAAGSLVIRAGAADGSASVSTSACLALNRSTGVRAAAGVAGGGLAYTSTSPGLGFRLLPAAGPIVPALTGQSQPSEPGLIVADEIAEQVGLAPGSQTIVDGTLTRISAVVPLGQRDPQLGRVAVSLGAPPPALTACYISFTDSYALQTLSTLLPAAFATTDNLHLVRLFATGDGTPDPALLWDTRTARNLYLPLGLLAALAYLLITRSHRHEQALYLVTGSTRAEVAFMILITGSWIVLTGLAVAVAWLALLAHLWRVPAHGFQMGILAATHTVTLTTALLPLSVTWLIRANLHRLVREHTT